MNYLWDVSLITACEDGVPRSIRKVSVDDKGIGATVMLTLKNPHLGEYHESKFRLLQWSKRKYQEQIGNLSIPSTEITDPSESYPVGIRASRDEKFMIIGHLEYKDLGKKCVDELASIQRHCGNWHGNKTDCFEENMNKYHTGFGAFLPIKRNSDVQFSVVRTTPVCRSKFAAGKFLRSDFTFELSSGKERQLFEYSDHPVDAGCRTDLETDGWETISE